jgi:hypothetical protein
MSERATFFLSSIGLLGEYCPTRKKNGHTVDKVGCMYLGLLEGCSAQSLGCRFIRPFPIANFIGKGGFLVTRKPASDLCNL